MLKLLFGSIGVLAVFAVATATAPSVGAGAGNNHTVTLRIERPASCTADVSLQVFDGQSNPPSVFTTTSGNQNVSVTARDNDFSIEADAEATNCSVDHLRAYLRVDGVTLSKVVDNSSALDDPDLSMSGAVVAGVGPVSVSDIGTQAEPTGDFDVRMRTTANPACDHVAALVIQREDELFQHVLLAPTTHSVRLPINDGDDVTGAAQATPDCPLNARIDGTLRQVGGPVLASGFTTLINGTFVASGTFNAP
ncbi:MAG TPA: hypothetical protein VFO84_09725 [Dehalococcoidia bacterium]|nr:hypothetical protein [Dehalococcoidia bacterium]